MLKHKKRTCLVALSLILAGIVIFIITYAATGFRWDAFVAETETKQYTVMDSFSSVLVNGVDADVILKQSSGTQADITVESSKYMQTTVVTDDDALKIDRVDTRPWYMRIGVFIREPKNTITIHLPQNAYEEIRITTMSGDIRATETLPVHLFRCETASGDVECSLTSEYSIGIRTISGDIFLHDSNAWLFFLHTTSGDIEAENIVAQERRSTVETTSGDIRLKYIQALSVIAATTSGEIEIEKSTVSHIAQLINVSGDIGFYALEAAQLKAQTISGDINGTVIGNMNYHTKTTSGYVIVPDSKTGGGEGTLTTVSGNISVSELNKQ